MKKADVFVVSTTNGSLTWYFNNLGCELDLLDNDTVFDTMTYLIMMNSKNKIQKSFYQAWQEAEAYYESDVDTNDDDYDTDDDWDDNWDDEDDIEDVDEVWDDDDDDNMW